MKKIAIDLPRPVEAPHDCLPHAALSLGTRNMSTTRPGGMVSRLVIQEQLGAWVFYRLDSSGGFVGDTWHPTLEDALHQARREFKIEIPDSI